MTRPADGDAVLTRNQSLVLETLAMAKGPLSAYAILDQLRAKGFRAPPQVYRALDKLMQDGMVHRLESINAYVACQHPDCGSRETMIFAICADCGDVAELSDDGIGDRFQAAANNVSFSVHKSTVELRGRCAKCTTH